MGTTSSRMLFTQIFKKMLCNRGAKVGQQQLCHFLEFVENVCPWFPEEGSVDLELWTKVGKQLQDYSRLEKTLEFLCQQWQTGIKVEEESQKAQGEGRIIPSIIAGLDPLPVAAPRLIKKNKPENPPKTECPPSAPPLVEGLDEPLDPSDAMDLEEEATEYSNEKWPPFSLIALTEKMKVKDKKDKSENTHPSNPLDMLWFNWKWKQKEQALLKERPLRPSILAGLDPFPEVARPDLQLDSPPVPRLSSPAPRPLSALQATLQAAAERGEDLAGFQRVCPVFKEPDQQGQMPMIWKFMVAMGGIKRIGVGPDSGLEGNITACVPQPYLLLLGGFEIDYESGTHQLNVT
ncbi:endogenous retrovirus group K member 19 Gag polyprotein-like [Heterocephalus glaber]|uniref:Endogenous retrovirus group K member 19 Gag polyprotein-like n=1 Tax=Heterocephalus glaber TaxID=10181 RepID=A0AAX6S5E4_HETGA|nr:endogenous retrovirus group K member 19 Gag polyprotein-like [Heterocephalus glaber]